MTHELAGAVSDVGHSDERSPPNSLVQSQTVNWRNTAETLIDSGSCSETFAYPSMGQNLESPGVATLLQNPTICI